MGLSPGWMTALPGEIFYDLLPHHLSLLAYLLPGIRLESASERSNGQGETTELNGLFSSATGTASLHLSLSTHPIQNNITIECSRGFIRVDFRNRLVLARHKSSLPAAAEWVMDNIDLGFQMHMGTVRNIWKFLRGRLDPYSGMEGAIRAFYDSVSNGKTVYISAENGLAVMSLMEEILQNQNQVMRWQSTQLVLERQPTPRIMMVRYCCDIWPISGTTTSATRSRMT